MTPLLRTLALLVVLALVAAACGGDDDDATDQPTPTEPTSGTAEPTAAPTQPASPVSLVTTERADPAADPRLAGETITAFALDLHRALDADTADSDNLVASPASVAIALGMLEPGTVDAAQAQLRTLLSITDAVAWHESVNALEQSLEARVPDDTGGEGDPGELEVAIANAAYLQRGFPFNATYLDTVGMHYGPVLNEVDFVPDPDAVAHEINDFVAETTRDRIPELIPDGVIQPETVLALVNALYMKASWLEPFDEAATSDAPFTLLDGTEVTVDMMEGSSTSSAQGDGWVGASKALTGNLDVQFILPDAGRFDEIEDRLGSVLDEYEEARTDGASFAMPRFESRFTAELTAALKNLGLTDVYEEGNLLGIADDPRLVVDKVLHETFVAMDETGVEAAAATAVLVGLTSGPVVPPVPVVLDRPFLFRIVDRETAATLFMGRIVDPLAGA